MKSVNTGSITLRPECRFSPLVIALFVLVPVTDALAAPNQETLGIVHLKGEGQGGFVFGVGHDETGIPRGAASPAQEKTGFTSVPSESFERTVGSRYKLQIACRVDHRCNKVCIHYSRPIR